MKSQNHSVIGICSLAIGCVLLAGAADLGPIRADDINGPAWIGALAGAIFALTGLAVLLRRGDSVLGQLLGLLILVCFSIVGAWIALGPGPRECSANFAGLLFDDTGDLPCRVVFGYGAVIVLAMALWALARIAQTLAGGPPGFCATVKLGENLIILSIVPLLLVPLLMITVPVAFGVIRHRLKTGEWPRNEAFRRKQAKKRAKASASKP